MKVKIMIPTLLLIANMQPGYAQVASDKNRNTRMDSNLYKVPVTIEFDYEVIQQMANENGSKQQTIEYHFTKEGDYAAMKSSENDGLSWMIYTKEGATLMIDDRSKTITVMALHKIIGEGAKMGKDMAEGMNKKPLPKPTDREKMEVTKTGNTKAIFGYPAYEYIMKNEKGTMSWWYAKVDFDPILIYTMGAGKMGDLSKLKDNPAMQHNPMAIPVINKNYLSAEIDANGKAFMQIKSITKKSFTITTAGYKIKMIGKLADMMRGNDQ